MHEIPSAIPVWSEAGIPVIGHVDELSESVGSFFRLEVPDEVFHAVAAGGFDE